jgi:hypothetical protein
MTAFPHALTHLFIDKGPAFPTLLVISPLGFAHSIPFFLSLLWRVEARRAMETDLLVVGMNELNMGQDRIL